MDRKKWTALFIRYGEVEAVNFHRKYQSDLPHSVISEPAVGLTMIKVREHAQNTLFYLGELLVTETKLRAKAHVGLGVVKGERRELSTALAFIDLCMKQNVLQQELAEILEKLSQKEDDEVHDRTQRILKTRVNFDMMND